MYETLATLQTPTGLVVTPLGVELDGDKLKAIIYPGTRLSAATDAYEACLTASSDPEAYALAARGKPISLKPPEAIHTPCIRGDAYIETVVTNRRRLDWGATELTLEPITYHWEEPPKPYTRLLGCTVEALIAATRIEYWSRQRPSGCTEAEKQLEKALQALHAAQRATRGNTEPLRPALEVVIHACSNAATRGCPLTCPTGLKTQPPTRVTPPSRGGALPRDQPRNPGRSTLG